MIKITKIFLILTCLSSFSYASYSAEYNSSLLQYNIQFSPPQGWNQISLGPFEVGIEGIAFRSPDEKAAITISLPKKSNSLSFHMILMFFRVNVHPKEKKITFLGTPCYVFDFEQINKKNIKIQTRTYKFLKNNKLYTISFYAASLDFQDYLPEFIRALGSFKIIE